MSGLTAGGVTADRLAGGELAGERIPDGVRIGILALQGDVREHRAMLERLGADVSLVRSPAELASVDGLVIPGGESSTMWRLAKLTGLVADASSAPGAPANSSAPGAPANSSAPGAPASRNHVGRPSPTGPLPDAVRNGLPVFGTCAGLIMLATTVIDAAPGQRSLGVLDVSVRRNAFGSQLDSFETDLPMPVVAPEPLQVAFIRAPIVEAVGAGVEVLGSLSGGRVVAVRQGNVLGCSFHPELTGESRLHEHFLELVAEHARADAA